MSFEALEPRPSTSCCTYSGLTERLGGLKDYVVGIKWKKRFDQISALIFSGTNPLGYYVNARTIIQIAVNYYLLQRVAEDGRVLDDSNFKIAFPLITWPLVLINMISTSRSYLKFAEELDEYGNTILTGETSGRGCLRSMESIASSIFKGFVNSGALFLLAQEVEVVGMDAAFAIGIVTFVFNLNAAKLLFDHGQMAKRQDEEAPLLGVSAVASDSPAVLPVRSVNGGSRTNPARQFSQSTGSRGAREEGAELSRGSRHASVAATGL